MDGIPVNVSAVIRTSQRVYFLFLHIRQDKFAAPIPNGTEKSSASNTIVIVVDDRRHHRHVIGIVSQ